MRRSLICIWVGLVALGCSSTNNTKPLDAGSEGATDGPAANGCASPPMLVDNFMGCSGCSFASSASPAQCTDPRPVNACCAWLQQPTTPLARGLGLHYYSSMDSTVDLGCLANPTPAGQSQMVTLTGYVKLFAHGDASQNVKIEIFQEGPNGTLSQSPVGTPVTTPMTNCPALSPAPTWSTLCPTGGCTLCTFTYAGVPTETPLVIKTSDATTPGGGGTWADLYDYNIYIANSAVTGGMATYNPSAVASTDINTIAAVSLGSTVKPGMGVLAGEVHDCGDVRLSGATVDSDEAHEGQMFYFNTDESDPLPDTSRSQQGLGTSNLGLFGALNLAAGSGVRVSATGLYNGQVTLIGTYVVQIFPGAVTALSFRGRRPYQ